MKLVSEKMASHREYNLWDLSRAGDCDGVAWALEMAPASDATFLDPDGNTPLHVACEMGWLGVAELLLPHTRNVNAPNHALWTPLHLAAVSGNSDLCALLLRAGASPRSVTSGSKCNALHLAADKGHTAVCRAILETGEVPVDGCTVEGWTPLLLCASKGHADTAELVLGFGAMVNAPDPANRETPLHKACRLGHHGVARRLLDSGATFTLDAKGRSPLDYALEKGFKWSIRVAPLEEMPALYGQLTTMTNRLHTAERAATAAEGESRAAQSAARDALARADRAVALQKKAEVRAGTSEVKRAEAAAQLSMSDTSLSLFKISKAISKQFFI